MELYLVWVLGTIVIFYAIMRSRRNKKRNDEKDEFVLAQYMALSGADREEVMVDKGINGEFAIYKLIQKMNLGGYVLPNLYVPYKTSMTEIDLLWIHKTGVYVIESKNYSGKVYGYEDSKNWAQYLGGQKYTFYNPISQNQTHINVLAANGIPKECMSSIIVFGSNTTLQKVTVSDAAPPILTLDELPSYCKKMAKSRKTIYTDMEVSRLANDLFQAYALASDDIKAKHVERVRLKYGTTA